MGDLNFVSGVSSGCPSLLQQDQPAPAFHSPGQSSVLTLCPASAQALGGESSTAYNSYGSNTSLEAQDLPGFGDSVVPRGNTAFSTDLHREGNMAPP